jgi:hypothetical protein
MSMNVHPIGAATPSLIIKRWKDLNTDERYRELIRCAARQDGQAVTLNFAPDFADRIQHAAAPMRLIGKRMNAALTKADLAALPVLLVLEATRADGRPHVHGVFISNGLEKQRIQQVMREAVGFVSGRRGARQFMAKTIYDPDGWTSYIYEDCKVTRKMLKLAKDERLTWVSRAMTACARDSYEAIRLGHIGTANINAGLAVHGT